MKILSLIVLSGFLTVSCATKKACCSKDHCDKKQEMSCCKQEKDSCKDGHCKKDKADCKDGSCSKGAPKTEEKKQ